MSYASTVHACPKFDTIGVVLPRQERKPYRQFEKKGAVFIDPSASYDRLPRNLPVVLMFKATPEPERDRLKNLLVARGTENVCLCTNVEELATFLNRRLIAAATVTLSSEAARIIDDEVDAGASFKDELRRLCLLMARKKVKHTPEQVRDYLYAVHADILEAVS